MTPTKFAAALSWNAKNLTGRLDALNLLTTCSRCGGSGSYSYCQMYGDTCFKCSGSGKGLPRLSATLVKTVQAKVAAGELAPYFAVCKAKAEARALILPLAKEARAVYSVIGDAYSVASSKKTVIPATFVTFPIFFAQGMNNDIYYGNHTGRAKKPISCMSVYDIESALKNNEIDPRLAVTLIRERVAQLETLRDAFMGSVAQAA